MGSPFPADCAERFHAVRSLASGGYGAVWLARQISLERDAAVKLLRGPALTDPAELERFESEARMTASLTNPHVVRIYDHGAGEGSPWIAYEYLPGETIAAALERGRFSAGDALAVAAQVASALEAAHEHGILHRDVKPENIVRDAGGHCKLMDFGIGKWARGATQTADGVVLGTPGFIAPEQITGAPAGPAADLYALGALLYVMLTGRLPFEARDPIRLFEQQVREDPPPPSTFVPALARDVDALAVAALARDPRARPRDARAFREELERLRGGPALHATAAIERPARPARAHGPTRVQARRGDFVPAVTPLAIRLRRRLPALGLALAAIVALAALVRPGRQASTLTSPAPGASAAEALRIATLTEQVRGFEAALRFREAADVYRALLKIVPAHRAWAQRLAELERELGHAGVAEPIFRRLVADDPADPYARLGLADLHLKLQRFDEAERELRALVEKPFPSIAMAHHLLAVVLWAQGHLEDAARAETDAVHADTGDGNLHMLIASDLARQGRRAFGREHVRVAAAASPLDPQQEYRLGLWSVEEGDWRAAIPRLRRALDRAPGDAGMRRALADAYYRAGDLVQSGATVAPLLAAEPADPEALALAARVAAGTGHPGDALALIERLRRALPGIPGACRQIEILRLLQRRAEADAQLEQLMAALDASTDAPAVAMAGGWLYGQNELARAVRAFQRAHRLDPKNLQVLRMLGTLLSQGGDHLAACDAFLEVLALPDCGDDDQWLVWSELGVMQDEPARERILRRAADAAPHAPFFPKALAELAVKHGNTEEALRWYRKAQRLTPSDAGVKKGLEYLEVQRVAGVRTERQLRELLENRPASPAPPASPPPPRPGAPAAP